MNTNNEPNSADISAALEDILQPKVDIAHAAIRTVALMAAILQATDDDRTYEECVTMARSLYTRTMRQIEEHGL